MKRKTLKRTGVAVLSMAMILSMGAVAMPVYAENEAKTVNVFDISYGNNQKATISDVKVYQVATRDATTGQWAWATPYAGVTATTFANLSKLSASDMNKLANDLLKVVKDTTKAEAVRDTLVSGEVTALAGSKTGKTTVLDVTGVGYYLIVPVSADNSVVIQPSLRPIDSTGTDTTDITPKANPLPLEKKITATTDGDVSSTGDTSVGIIGSTVEYKISSYLPDYASDVTTVMPYILTDDPSDGIKINNDDFTATGSNVVVKINNVVNTTATVLKAGDGFTVTVPSSTVLGHKGEPIEVTFKATIDTDAVLGDDYCTDKDKGIHTKTEGNQEVELTGNPNTVKLTWGNNYSTGNYAYPTDHTPEPDEPEVPTTPKVEKKDSVTTFAAKLLVEKFAGDTQAPMSGVQFELTSNNGYSKTLTTDGNGEITEAQFGYLPAGTYTLTEKEPPANYQKVAPYTFTVVNKPATGGDEFTTYEFTESATAVSGVTFTANEDNNADVTITVKDPPADTLPATGGIGTYVFTFGGAAIILLAGVLFVVYMKKRKVEE